MAKMRFDVDTLTKIIDVNKQFIGGLKTVDTDDSLGSFFLRDAENISLSEYGFIEKRYGIVDSLNIDTTGLAIAGTDIVQGYFEYFRIDGYIDKILFVGGRLYLKRAESTTFSKITTLQKKDQNTPYITDDLFNNYLDDFWGFSNVTINSFDNLFDTGNEIEAVRIEDTLYIFTGIYPIIYEGDGKFYLLPEFIPDFTELKIFSHNIHNSNNAAAYNEPIFEVGNSQIVTDSSIDRVFEFASETIFPRLPFVNNQGSIFNIELAYRLHQDLLPATDFRGFLLESKYPAGPNDNGLLADISPRVYYRPAGIGASELEWREIPRSSLLFRHRTNSAPIEQITTFGTYSEEFAPPDFSLHPEGISYYDLDVKSPGESIRSTDPFEIGIINMPVGTYDVRVDLIFRVSGYQYIGDELSTNLAYKTTELEPITRVYRDITFTEEKLQDYTEIDPAGLWTCNKVLNHFGKLMVYGSDINPERVYIGHPTYTEFFPEFFTIDFETDEEEPVQQITPFMNILVVQSETYTWGLKGIDALIGSESPYQQFTISPLYGTIAPKSVRPVRNQLFFLSREGIVSLQSLYAIDDQYNVKHIDQNIENIVPLDPDAVALQFDNQYWIHFPNSNPVVTFRYYVDNKSWVKDTHFEWNGLNQNGEPQPSSIVFNGFFGFRRKDGDLFAITNPIKFATGNFKILKLLIDESIPTDLGEAPKTLFETAYMNQGMPFHPKKYMEQRYDFTIQNEFNFAADGVVFQKDNVTINNLETAFDVTTLKKNHQYKIAFTHPFMQTSGVVLDEFNNPYPAIVEPQYAIQGITLFDKAGNVVGSQTVPQTQAKAPTIFDVSTEYDSVSFYIINNDDDNADMVYYVDNPNNGGTFRNIGTRNLSDRITISGLSVGNHVIYVQAKTVDTLDSPIVTEQFTISALSVAPTINETSSTIGDDNITLVWSDGNVPRSTQFRIGIQDLTRNLPFQQNVIINNSVAPNAPVTSYPIQNLIPGYQYRVRIGAFDSESEEWSPYRYYTFYTDYLLPRVDLQELNVLATPTNTTEENQIFVQWYDLNAEDFYRVQYINRNSEFTEVNGTIVQTEANERQTTLQFSNSDRHTVFKLRIRGGDTGNEGFGEFSKVYEFLPGMDRTANPRVLRTTPESPQLDSKSTDYIIFTYPDFPTVNRYKFSIAPAGTEQFSTPVTKTYEAADTDGFVYKFAALNPDTPYDIKMILEFDVFMYVSANTGLQTIFSSQPAVLANIRTDIPVPGQTIAPQIFEVDTSRYSITWNILNRETDGIANIYGALGTNPTGNFLGIVAASSSLPNPIVTSNLQPGTTYRFSASAKEDNETMSQIVFADLTTLPQILPNQPGNIQFSGTTVSFGNISVDNTSTVRAQLFPTSSYDGQNAGASALAASHPNNTGNNPEQIGFVLIQQGFFGTTGSVSFAFENIPDGTYYLRVGAVNEVGIVWSHGADSPLLINYQN